MRAGALRSLNPFRPTPGLRTCRSWSQPTGDAAKLQRLQRLQGPFPPAGLQSRKKLYPASTSHLAGGGGGGRQRREEAVGRE